MTKGLPRLESDDIVGEAGGITAESLVGVYLMESGGKFQVTNEYRVHTCKQL